MVPERHFDSDGELRRYETLLHMADLVVHHRGLAELFRELAQRLREFAAFELATFSLHDSSKNVMRVHVWEGADLAPTAAEVPVEDSPIGGYGKPSNPWWSRIKTWKNAFRVHWRD